MRCARSLGKGTPRELARTTVGVGASLSPAPVPRALLIRVLRLVAVRRPPALRRGLTEVVPDTPAQERAPVRVTPASPPAVAARAAQRVLQSPHGAHAPSAPPARPGSSRRASGGEEGGAEEWRPRLGAPGTVPRPAEPAVGRAGRVGGVGVRGGASPGRLRPRRCTHSPFTASNREAPGFDGSKDGGGWAGVGVVRNQMDRDRVQSLRRRNAGRRGKAREAGTVSSVAGTESACAQSEFVETRQGWGRCALVQMKCYSGEKDESERDAGAT